MITRRDNLRIGVVAAFIATTTMTFLVNWLGMGLASDIAWDSAFGMAGQYTLTVSGPAFAACYAIYRYAVARL